MDTENNKGIIFKYDYWIIILILGVILLTGVLIFFLYNGYKVPNIREQIYFKIAISFIVLLYIFYICAISSMRKKVIVTDQILSIISPFKKTNLRFDEINNIEYTKHDIVLTSNNTKYVIDGSINDSTGFYRLLKSKIKPNETISLPFKLQINNKILLGIIIFIILGLYWLTIFIAINQKRPIHVSSNLLLFLVPIIMTGVFLRILCISPKYHIFFSDKIITHFIIGKEKTIQISLLIGYSTYYYNTKETLGIFYDKGEFKSHGKLSVHQMYISSPLSDIIDILERHYHLKKVE